MNTPKFKYGEEVRLIQNIRNDGSIAKLPKGRCLKRRGSTGYVRQAGLFLNEHIVYQVHFLDTNEIIGCKETELIDAQDPWTDNQFEYGDRALLILSLTMQGEKIASKGDEVAIISVLRDSNNINYRVQRFDKDFIVPERALRQKTEDTTQ